MTTLADVAQRAGVSKTTASRVLNGLAERYRITTATVVVVEEAARAIGYRPSYAARALTRGRTDCIGVLMGSRSLVQPSGQIFAASILGGINEAVRPKGLHVVLASELDSAQTMGSASTPSDRFDALIAFNYVLGPHFSQFDVGQLATPMVVVGEPAVPTERPVVTLDPEPGLRAAVAHLAELRHRNIAWISLARSVHDHAGNPSPEDATWRARCLVNLAAQENINCSVVSAGLAKPFWQMTREQAIAELGNALRPALAGLHGVTALCCYNDLVALAVLRILRERNVSVPGEVSVIGFDNLLSDIADPALTTIDHCLVDIGRRAGEIALEYINDPTASERYRAHRENVPARLVIRASTGIAAGT